MYREAQSSAAQGVAVEHLIIPTIPYTKKILPNRVDCGDAS